MNWRRSLAGLRGAPHLRQTGVVPRIGSVLAEAASDPPLRETPAGPYRTPVVNPVSQSKVLTRQACWSFVEWPDA